jgi:hypothetical protein
MSVFYHRDVGSLSNKRIGHYNVTAPRWWYSFLAVCIAALTIAASYRLVTDRAKWEHLVENGIFNPRTGETCWAEEGKMTCTKLERAARGPASDSGPITPLYDEYLREIKPRR